MTTNKHFGDFKVTSINLIWLQDIFKKNAGQLSVLILIFCEKHEIFNKENVMIDNIFPK